MCDKENLGLCCTRQNPCNSQLVKKNHPDYCFVLKKCKLHILALRLISFINRPAADGLRICYFLLNTVRKAPINNRRFPHVNPLLDTRGRYLTQTTFIGRARGTAGH